MNKHEILNQALQQRIDEVIGYQINIDNYQLAILHIDQMQDFELSDFRQRLIDLLASEKLEQKKAKVMLYVIEQQLKEYPCSTSE